MTFQETVSEGSRENRRETLTIPKVWWGRRGKIESPDGTQRLSFSFRVSEISRDDGQEHSLREVNVLLFARRPGGEKDVLLRGLRVVERANGEREIVIRVDSLRGKEDGEEKDDEQTFDHGEYSSDDNEWFVAGSFTPEMDIQVVRREWQELGFVPTGKLPKEINVEATAEEIMALVRTQFDREQLDENLPIPKLVIGRCRENEV